MSSTFPAGVRTYSPLGRSGLLVSPLCLGTMTFGTEWGWGAPKDTAFALLAKFLDAGGNFVDTADGYTNGTSQELIGEFLAQPGRRERVVLATSSASTSRPATRTRAATAASTSCARSRARCGASGRTTSTSTGCTPGTGARPSRNRVDARCARTRRQDPTLRALELPGLVRGARGHDRRAARARAPVRAPARVLAGRAQHRARARAGGARARTRFDGLEPARERNAHRQVPPRCARCAG